MTKKRVVVYLDGKRLEVEECDVKFTVTPVRGISRGKPEPGSAKCRLSLRGWLSSFTDARAPRVAR